MKVALVVSGTRGDVQPLIALALGLKARGHDSLVIAPPENEGLANRYGCPFQALGANVEEFTTGVPEPARHPVKATKALAAFLKNETLTQFQELPAVIKGADLVLGATFVFGARSIAEAQGIPYRFVAYCPQVLPSGSHPNLAIANHRRSRLFNRGSWWLFSKLGNITYASLINQERKRLGLAPITGLWNYLLGEHVFVASDPELGGIPDDVGMRVSQVGHMPLKQHGELNQELLAFLETGAPPVYIGFGSMRSDDPDAITRTVLDAANASGRRVLLAPGWGNVSAIENNKQCHVIGEVPHTKLFPRLAAVVHHGGAGTVATAARAGVPQVIVPYMSDQYYWANQVERLGIGPPAVWKSRLNAKRLGSATSRAVSDDAIRHRVREIAGILQSTDGVSTMIDLIESEFAPNASSGRSAPVAHS
jgi:UDP:flavonoid glycosyltransferase YjiC (YdhE family)